MEKEERKMKWKIIRELWEGGSLGASISYTVDVRYDYFSGIARSEPCEGNVQPPTATTTPGTYASPHLAGSVKQVALTRDSLGAYISFTPHRKGKNSYIECLL